MSLFVDGFFCLTLLSLFGAEFVLSTLSHSLVLRLVMCHTLVLCILSFGTLQKHLKCTQVPLGFLFVREGGCESYGRSLAASGS
jgi:hypothetical protein